MKNNTTNTTTINTIGVKACDLRFGDEILHDDQLLTVNEVEIECGFATIVVNDDCDHWTIDDIDIDDDIIQKVI